MKIFIDIGHPAHVHYFRNFISIMKKKEHSIFVCARDKDVSLELLNYYGIKYVSRGKGKKNIFGKALNIINNDIKIYQAARKYQPDLFLSFGSPYAAHVSKMLGKPHIAFDDTDIAKYEHMLYVPFTDVVLTPKFYKKNFGKKHLFFDSYMEMCYLHEKYFAPDEKIMEYLGLKKYEKFVILRFISWNANHDIGQRGLLESTKDKIIEILQKKYVVFISAEEELPEKYANYKLKIKPAMLHSVLANASLYIGEGSTTASECSILGVPSVYVNSLRAGNCLEQQETYGLCFNINNGEDIIPQVIKIMENDNIAREWAEKRRKLLSEKIDVTAMMVWFIENYPQSYLIMKNDQEYQYKFR